MILGFTGTRDGMTRLQQALFVGVLARLCPEEFHHGDGLEADAQAHNMVRQHVPRCRIIIHPPTNDALRAFCEGDEIRAPQPYLIRNLAIAACVDELAAAPKTSVEELRSGTWATVRYARRALKPVHILKPWDR